jgi:hypothetical protein
MQADTYHRLHTENFNFRQRAQFAKHNIFLVLDQMHKYIFLVLIR